jgi:hypothetical protein
LDEELRQLFGGFFREGLDRLAETPCRGDKLDIPIPRMRIAGTDAHGKDSFGKVAFGEDTLYKGEESFFIRDIMVSGKYPQDGVWLLGCNHLRSPKDTKSGIALEGF